MLIGRLDHVNTSKSTDSLLCDRLIRINKKLSRYTNIVARSLYTMQRHILATGKRVIYKVYMALSTAPNPKLSLI